MSMNRHESEPIYRESLRNGIETERNEPIYFSQFETICFKLKKTNFLHPICVLLYLFKYRKEIEIINNLENGQLCAATTL